MRLNSPPIRLSGPADHLRRFGACQRCNRFGRCPTPGAAGRPVGFQPAAKVVRCRPSDATILDAVGRLVTQAAGASARGGSGQAPRCRRTAPARVRRFCAGRACPVHAAARLRCVSLGDVEAEPERALLLTVRRYDTVQDGAATRLAAQAGGTRRALQPGALVRSLYLRAVPASPPPPAIEAQPAKLMRQPPDCVLDYPWPADYRRNNVMKDGVPSWRQKRRGQIPCPGRF